VTPALNNIIIIIIIFDGVVGTIWCKVHFSHQKLTTLDQHCTHANLSKLIKSIKNKQLSAVGTNWCQLLLIIGAWGGG
jgi:hypothetical protein